MPYFVPRKVGSRVILLLPRASRVSTTLPLPFLSFPRRRIQHPCLCWRGTVEASGVEGLATVDELALAVEYMSTCGTIWRLKSPFLVKAFLQIEQQCRFSGSLFTDPCESKQMMPARTGRRHQSGVKSFRVHLTLVQ